MTLVTASDVLLTIADKLTERGNYNEACRRMLRWGGNKTTNNQTRTNWNGWKAKHMDFLDPIQWCEGIGSGYNIWRSAWYLHVFGFHEMK